MISQDCVLNCDLSTASNLFLSDKETQTSKVYDIDSISSKKSPSRPLPQNIEAVTKDDNVKVFEHCEIIQDPDDPESVTIIKETFTEEVLTECDSFFDTPTKNKYKYCKEVIQPYSKSHPKDCPSFPKCKHKCKDFYDQQSQEVCLNDNEKTMNSDKCKTTFVNPNNKTDKCENKANEKKTSSCCSIETNKAEKPPCEKPKPPACQSEPFDECKLKRCITSCISESLKLAKKGSATCLEKFEKVIGVQQPKECDEKPTFYVMEKPISRTDSSSSTIPKKNSQSIFESQSQTVANITCAIKGFMGVVYNKTKEAVNMIKTESCRHLGINDEPKSTSKENKSQQKTKECSSKVSEIKTESLFDRIRSQTSKAEESNEFNNESYNIEKILEPAKEVLAQVASAVDSTISILRNSSFEKIVDDILEGKISKSSAYDDPDVGKKPPKKIAQDHEPGTNSSVFAMIKAKFFSMFDIQQETCDGDDNNDEDDESSAEKLFDKYCEQ